MKLVIQKEPDDTVEISLKAQIAGIALIAKTSTGSRYQLGVFQDSGTFRRYGDILEGLGFKLDDSGRIKVE